ncbi:MAG: pre-toxin TG domain-containing protein, partial [Bdellovibrionia bacterium]
MLGFFRYFQLLQVMIVANLIVSTVYAGDESQYFDFGNDRCHLDFANGDWVCRDVPAVQSQTMGPDQPQSGPGGDNNFDLTSQGPSGPRHRPDQQMGEINAFNGRGPSVMYKGTRVYLELLPENLRVTTEAGQSTLTSIDRFLPGSKLQPFMDYLKKESSFFESKSKKLESDVAKLKEMSANGEFNHFDDKSSEFVTQLTSIDKGIHDLYNDLKTPIQELKKKVESERTENQKRKQEYIGNLKSMASLIKETIAPAHYEFKIDNFNWDSTHSSAVGATSSGLNHPTKISEHAESNIWLNEAKARIESGQRSEFLAFVRTQSRSRNTQLQHLRMSGGDPGLLLAMQNEQNKLSTFVRTQLDNYGFFHDVRVEGKYKRIVERLQSYDVHSGDDLGDELNKWNSELNPHQQEVLREMDDINRALDRLERFVPASERDHKIKDLSDLSMKFGVRALTDAARNANHGGNTGDFTLHLAEAQTGVSVTLNLLDFALGFVPVVSTGKSFFEAITATNAVTGLPLSDAEWTFAIVGAVSLGSSNYFKGALSGLSKISAMALTKWGGHFAKAHKAV